MENSPAIRHDKPNGNRPSRRQMLLKSIILFVEPQC